MKAFDRWNDGTQNPPRLQVQQALWGMSGLPLNGTEWSLTEKILKIKEAGFEGVEAWLGPDDEAEVAALAHEHELTLSLGHRPYVLQDTQKVVEQALRLGARYVVAQVSHAYASLEEVAALVREGRALANASGIPYFVETHRNTFTETVPQTLALIAAVPELRITADLSHLVVVGEFYGGDAERAHARMQPILERVSHIHGRVSNGEQVQVDCGDGSTPWARFFVQLWTIAMRHWLDNAGPGDVLPFSAELGPPRYAITLPDGREFSDRWEQALLMGRLAQEAWNNARQAP